MNGEFWNAFAVAYLALAHTNRPLYELAERLDVPMNRLKSWGIQARKNGFLAPSRGKGVKSPGPGPNMES